MRIFVLLSASQVSRVSSTIGYGVPAHPFLNPLEIVLF